MSFYQIIVPIGADRRNLASNPSLELGTTGWGTIQGGTVGTTSGVQAFGAWSGSVAPSNNGTAGVLGPAFTAGNGTAYGYSFYGSFPVGSVFRAGIGDSSGNSLLGSFIGTGGGSWHRYMGSFTESAGASRRLAVRKNGNAATDAFYIDAVQYEVGSVTTYIDGDQGAGYLWDGPPHASTSLRTAGVRTGGTVYDLGALGFTVLEHAGVGMPDVTAILQDYGYLPGANYQRTHVNARSFLLTGLMSGTTFQHLHAIRQQVIQTIKPDLTPTPQPFRILYTGAGGSVFIDGIYDSGMQLQSPQGFAEVAAMRIVAPDPYWQTVTERGTSLAPFVTFGSVNYIARRDPTWQWGTLGASGTTTNGVITALGYRSGTLFIGGGFTSIGGTQSGRLAMLYPSGAFGTFGGTVGGGTVVAIAPLASGTVVFGGDFTQISGVSNVRFIAQVSSGGFGTLQGGTVIGTVTGMAQTFGVVAVGGSFGYTGGSHLALWTPGVGYGGGLTIGSPVASVAAAQDGRVIVGMDGNVTGTTTGNGTVFWGIAQYNVGLSAWGTMGGGIRDSSGADTDPGRVDAITVGSSGIVYAGGAFRGAGGNDVGNVASWSEPLWRGVGENLGGEFPDANAIVNALVIDPRTGLLYGGGDRATLQVALGGTWGSVGFARGRTGITAMLFAPDRTLYVAMTGNGVGTFGAVTTVVNPGNARTPVRLRITAPDNASAAIDHLVNATTDAGIFWGNYAPTITPGDTATLDTTPGSVAYTSLVRGNRLGDILPGSNLSEWLLQGGTNHISTYVTPGTARVDLIYRPRMWSADGSIS